jgi:hypothetical protein
MKNIKYIIICFMLTAFTFSINAQQQNRFWYFGNNIGIDFGSNLDDPQPIVGIGNSTNEGSGVISDNNGEFLFYTDGSSAINNLGNTFANNLGGNPSSTQSSIAIPDPSNCEDYYIVSVGAAEITESWGLFFDKISSRSWTVLESGSLNCPTCVEKVNVIPHVNEKDYWVISVQPNSKIIPIYLLDENGINRTPASQLPLTFLPNEFSSRGYGAVKISHDGSMLAIAHGPNSQGPNGNRVDLFSFDNSTGIVTGLLNSFTQSTAYGLEFSPNNQYLFVSGLGQRNSSSNNGNLAQYQTTAPYNQVNFIETNSASNYDGGALQLAPDGKIYYARDFSNSLDVINNPNSNSWNYQNDAITFSCTNCVRLGLPNLVGSPNECDPCDISNSLIPNPDFEILVNSTDLPDDLAQLDKLQDWIQATEATSDYLNFISIENPSDFLHVGDISNRPPNGSNNFVGLHWNFPNTHGVNGEYVEYVGACTNDNLLADTDYTIEFYIGSTDGSDTRYSNLGYQGDIVFLGIPDCSMLPLSGTDCKEDNFDIIGRTTVSVPPDIWLQQKINVVLNGPNNYEAILFGPSCNPYPDAGDNLRSYFLIDEILIVEGDIECGSTCYTITAEAPTCNDDNASYTYDFSLINNMEDNSFDKLLILDQDEGFTLDLDGQTLLQLDETVGPGQSIDLSWTIEGTSSEESEFCFDIIPYNPAGEMCCKEQHCVTLESCCMGDPIATLTTEEVDLGEDTCCYAIDYENICLPDYYTRLQVQMMTPGLGLSVGTLANSDFIATIINASLIELTYDNGATFPEGVYDDVMSYCVSGLTHTSPDMQEVRYSWFASVDGGPEAIVELNTETTICPLPMAPDTCTVISEDMLYCDDNGVYHYRFKVTNLSQGEYDATVLVIGPLGDTEPSDFSQQTFPDFPDNTPGASPFLEYGETTDFLDVALPNASLGDSYSFFLSMHDYRMPLDDGDYWCCFDTLDVITLDIDFPCSGSGIAESPLEHDVYPNPVHDNFTLRFKRRIPANAEMLIMNTSGNLMDVHVLETDSHFHTVDTGAYLPGLYYVMVRDDMGHVTYSKFIRG